MLNLRTMMLQFGKALRSSATTFVCDSTAFNAQTNATLVQTFEVVHTERLSIHFVLSALKQLSRKPGGFRYGCCGKLKCLTRFGLVQQFLPPRPLPRTDRGPLGRGGTLTARSIRGREKELEHTTRLSESLQSSALHERGPSGVVLVRTTFPRPTSALGRTQARLL